MALVLRCPTRLPRPGTDTSYKVNTWDWVLKLRRRRTGLLDSCGTGASQLFSRTGKLFFHLLVYPLIKEFHGTRGHVEKAQSDVTFKVSPCYFRFHVQGQPGFGQCKLQTRGGTFGKCLVHDESDPAFADVGTGGFYLLVAQHHSNQHLNRLPVVTAPFALHET